MRLEQHAAGARREWPVIDAGRAHRVGVVAELLAPLAVLVVAHDEVAGEQEHLFPILVHERLGGKGTGLDPQHAGAVATLVLLIEGAGENLLGKTGRIARNGVPAGLHIHGVKFMVPLVETHGGLLYWNGATS